MLHLVKLAVGIRDVAHLAAVQQARAAADPPLRHLTRSAPRRAGEVLAGGSIYWSIAGTIQVRQRILAIEPATRPDGSACTALVLEPTLTRVLGQPIKPFQGWRYLRPEDAPPDLAEAAAGTDDMPAEMQAALRALGLL